MAFGDEYGKIPEANRRPLKRFAPGYGKCAQDTAYNQEFSRSPDREFHEDKKVEKTMVKSNMKKQ